MSAPEPTAEYIAEAADLTACRHGDCTYCGADREDIARALAAAEARGIRKAVTVNGSTPYPLLDVLRILCDAVDHTLDAHSCDHHGYEVWSEARHAGRECIRELTRLATVGGPLEAPLDDDIRAAEARGFERASTMAARLLAVSVDRADPDHILRVKRVRDSFGLAEPGNVASGRPGLKETLDTLRECAWDEVKCRALLIDRGLAKEPR